MALVNIVFTVHTLITYLTLAIVSPLIIHTGPSISAWVGQTLIHLQLTVTASITSLTQTLVRVVFVHTASSILTNLVHYHTPADGNSLARHAGYVAVQACPAWFTTAPPIHLLLDACASILTLNLTANIDH